MRTFDARGRLLGDSSLTPVDVTASYIDNTPLAPITVTATNPAAPAWYDSLLKPPTIYYVGAGLAFLAWLLNERPARR